MYLERDQKYAIKSQSEFEITALILFQNYFTTSTNVFAFRRILRDLPTFIRFGVNK